jgi:hypothetical protein
MISQTGTKSFIQPQRPKSISSIHIIIEHTAVIKLLVLKKESHPFLEKILEIDDISKNSCSGGVISGSCTLDHQRGALIASAVYLHLIRRNDAFVTSQQQCQVADRKIAVLNSQFCTSLSPIL